jgi:hypothetical protein
MPTGAYVDLEGDGQVEQVLGDGNRTRVIKNGTVIWDHTGWIDGWNRGDNDAFYGADLNGDHKQQIVVANNVDRWTGILTWDGQALHLQWGSPSPLNGPAGGWNRGDDIIIVSDIDHDGADEIVVANNSSKWTGMLKLSGPGLQPIWMSPSPLTGPAGQWNRRDDAFRASSDGVIVVDGPDGWHGMLKWQNNSLQVVNLTKDKDSKEQNKDNKDDKDYKENKDNKDQKDDPDEIYHKEDKDSKDEHDKGKDAPDGKVAAEIEHTLAETDPEQVAPGEGEAPPVRSDSVRAGLLARRDPIG